MNKLNYIYTNIFNCSNCRKKYTMPWYKDVVTKDKIYDYELIDFTTIQTECHYCQKYNYIALKKVI